MIGQEGVWSSCPVATAQTLMSTVQDGSGLNLYILALFCAVGGTGDTSVYGLNMFLALLEVLCSCKLMAHFGIRSD